ncbi:hypothetical protein AGMMS49593_09960 [Endomicrobiia bacterium]|nr:hypothetical protein AGMMS49593_09960 [Endomicrobiia bacterium]
MKRSLLVFCSFFALSIFAPAVAQADPVDFNLVRNAPVGNAVDGILTNLAGGGYICDTLENANHLVPAGTYQIVLNYSPRFNGYLPEIIGIPNRAGIRIHEGNVPAHSAGSILPGNPDPIAPGHIINSRIRLGGIVNLVRADQNRGIGSTITIN